MSYHSVFAMVFFFRTLTHKYEKKKSGEIEFWIVVILM